MLAAVASALPTQPESVGARPGGRRRRRRRLSTDERREKGSKAARPLINVQAEITRDKKSRSEADTQHKPQIRGGEVERGIDRRVQEVTR